MVILLLGPWNVVRLLVVILFSVTAHRFHIWPLGEYILTNSFYGGTNGSRCIPAASCSTLLWKPLRSQTLVCNIRTPHPSGPTPTGSTPFVHLRVHTQPLEGIHSGPMHIVLPPASSNRCLLGTKVDLILCWGCSHGWGVTPTLRCSWAVKGNTSHRKFQYSEGRAM